MIDRLVTVACFWSIVEAQLAKNQLVESGIEAFLADESTVFMAWHLANAIHGIKLLVKEADAAEARELLAADTGGPETAAAKELQEMVAQEMPAADADEAAADEPDVLTRREETAERAFRGAVIGIWLVPWQLCVTWLLVRVYFSEERLEPAYRRKAYVAAAINFLYVLMGCIFLKLFLGLPVFVAQV